MFRKMSLAFVLAGSAMMLAGCGRTNRPATEAQPDNKGAAVQMQTVTLHVRDMTERQGLT